ncbi:MAG: hypothetical protein ABR526_03100 [Chthoniobacterales bacterium]
MRTGMMVGVVTISFAMFACHDDVRNKFGRYYAQGYRNWRGETDSDDYGRPYYAGDEWTAATATGRRLVTLFEYAVFAGVFALPALTLKAARVAIRRKEAECSYTADGKRLETYYTDF